MLLDLKDLVDQYTMKITGVIHAGAHLGEEAAEYGDLGVGHNTWWIEANPMVIPKLSRHLAKYDQHLVEALLADVDGKEMMFHITNYDGMSSSIYEFGTHLQSSPDTVYEHHRLLKTKKLDTVVRDNGIINCNFLNMDLQGAELLCLKGATETLKKIDYVYTEVNVEEVYVGCAQLEDLDRLLHKFTRVETSMTPAGWGDALYCRSAP